MYCANGISIHLTHFKAGKLVNLASQLTAWNAIKTEHIHTQNRTPNQIKPNQKETQQQGKTSHTKPNYYQQAPHKARQDWTK